MNPNIRHQKLIKAIKDLKMTLNKCHEYVKLKINNDQLTLPEAMEIASAMKYDFCINHYFKLIKERGDDILNIKKLNTLLSSSAINTQASEMIS